MYKDIILDLVKQNISCDLGLIKDALTVYSKLLLFNNESKVRNMFWSYIKKWFKYRKMEYEILTYILRRYGNMIDSLEIDEVLDILDDYFTNIYDYIGEIIISYDEYISLKEKTRLNFKPSFNVLDEQEKNKLLKKIQNINDDMYCITK